MRVLLWSCDTGGTLLESNADASDQKSREVVSGCVSFDWDEQRELLAIGRSNGVAEVLKWDEGIDTSRAKLRFHEHLEGVTCMAWSDAGLLASGGEDGKIFVYSCGNANTPEAPDTAEHGQDSRVLSSIAAHSNKITGLKWCPDLAQGCLASCSSDGSVQIWDATSLQRKVYFNHHVGRVLSLEWVSPYTLVTGGEDQTLRLWDRREQPQDPPSKLKKPGKVKQPQEVEVITALPEQFDGSQQTQVEANTTDIVLGPSSADRSKTIAPSKTKKKAMTIFHPETKLTPIEVAIACRQISGVEKANDSIEVAVGMKPAEAALLTNTDRVQLRDFFASEAKRFREEREWENLANTLVLQGNVIEALGIVAKEGALSPAWLSYAPMAGMDVWREMTNLYAHQLDAQGDKKAAALHFLSIAKVRSAVTCLVSGDAYKEALALIRSRLGPNDPLLLDTLQKYSQFLVKRCRHGEAALALLSIGSVKATTRAIHMLVNTSDMIYVKAALDVLLAAVDSPTKINHHGENFENGDEELSFSASLFISIAGQALVKSRFDVAETAARLLQSPLVGASSSPLHRLTWCLLGIVRAIDEHKISHDNDGLLGLQLGDLLEPDSPPGISEFFEFLTSPHQHREESSADILYSRVLDEFAGETQIEGKSMKSSRTGRADHFWTQILSVCRGGGYWFDGVGNVRVQEAQDLLVEANCLGDIEKAVDAATTEQPDRSISLLLQVAQTLLRFMIDVMSGSFIGALEHMRETFRLLAQSGDMDRADYTNSASDTPSAPGVGELCLTVMTLLFPCGFASPKVLPQCGELADEQLDTLVLWSSILLLQCRIVLATAVLTAKNSSTEDVAQSLESLVRSLLHLLRVSFLGQELCEGLKDAENQSQLQTLLNEMVVASQLLPDGPSTSQVQNVDSSAGEVEQDDESKKCVSRKQALINDTDDLRSCLTWSEDGVK
ncbi:hypothetical protein ON010_g10493 [Phytophthora cinnamomi]|nr:hypothetical protein ON010_g10493 [Phytophthora cinnamomi]